MSAGAPEEVTEDLLKSFNISLVLRGTISETLNTCCEHDESRYNYPKSKEMFWCAWQSCAPATLPVILAASGM